MATRKKADILSKDALAPMDLKNHSLCRRLIQDLDLLDWPESLKKLQINWIGKSEGAKVRISCKRITRQRSQSLQRAPTPCLVRPIMVLLRNIPLWMKSPRAAAKSGCQRLPKTGRRKKRPGAHRS